MLVASGPDIWHTGWYKCEMLYTCVLSNIKKNSWQCKTQEYLLVNNRADSYIECNLYRTIPSCVCVNASIYSCDFVLISRRSVENMQR